MKHIFNEHVLLIQRNQKKDILIEYSKLESNCLTILVSGNSSLHEAIKSLFSDNKTKSNYVQINSYTQIASNITLEAT